MANEIRYSGLADLRLTETLSAEVLLLLADRNAVGMHPALMYIGDLGGSESLTKKVAEIGWNGYDALADVAEGASVSNTALTDSSVTVTVSRRAKSYIWSELAKITDVQGLLSTPSFARDAAVAAGVKLTNLIAEAGSGFSTNSAGSTTVDLNATDLIEASILLEIANADISSGLMCILHPRQYGDFQLDLATTTAGALQWNGATQEQLQVRGAGYKGNFLGIDIWSSSQVPTATAGADRGGCMFTRGAIAWGDATPAMDDNPMRRVVGKILLGTGYDDQAGETTTTMSYFCGVSKAIDAAGCLILSDA